MDEQRAFQEFERDGWNQAEVYLRWSAARASPRPLPRRCSTAVA